MIFSKSTSYALRAISYIACHPDRLCGVQEIADSQDIPPIYLRKILGELRRHRLLDSVKGIHGGYRIVILPDRITFWDVFAVMEPDRSSQLCLMACPGCRQETECEVRDEWQTLGKQVIAYLKSRKISEVVLPPRKSLNSCTPAFAAVALDGGNHGH